MWHLCRHVPLTVNGFGFIRFYVKFLRFWGLDPKINGVGWRSSGVGVRGRSWPHIPLRCISSLCQCSRGKWGVCVCLQMPTWTCLTQWVLLELSIVCFCSLSLLLRRNYRGVPVPTRSNLWRRCGVFRVRISQFVLFVYFLWSWWSFLFILLSVSLSGKYWRSLSYGKGERRYSAGTEAALVLDGLTMNVPNRSR